MSGQDLAVFRDGEKWGYQRADGSVAIRAQFDSAGSFSEGFARVRSGDRWGFIRPDGSYAIEPRFEQARHFSRGVAKVKVDGRWALVNGAGDWVEDVEAGTYLDDRGNFISRKDHQAWEKPPGRNAGTEGER